ncbi:NUDIX domain-containing protein [Bacteriovoracaceae bacterium]|nr:NUDIX domain-containing protein [Bacteriovoracaceae bacterium]|tara:strand:+ start:7002 stop:7388 length:387 start_codon:yes stop_codon:yes gene_type:complete
MLIPVSIVIPICRKEDQTMVWMQLRQEDGHLDGKWEFPGGKWEANELPEDCAKREFLEEVGVEIKQIDYFKTYPFQYSDRSVSIFSYVFLCKEAELKSGSWTLLNEVDLSKIPEANHQLIEDLKRTFN